MVKTNNFSGYKKYDIAIIGAGPAGIMAAISAASVPDAAKTSICLLERNESAAKKLLLTGNGRCNYTAHTDMDGMLSAFGKKGRFFSEAFNKFSNQDLIGFFKTEGIEPEYEKSGENETLIKVFPRNKNASSVQSCLVDKLQEKNINVFYGCRVEKVLKAGNPETKKEKYAFEVLPFKDCGSGLLAQKVILATGGRTYPQTGSTGDGYKIAKNLGHSINELFPFLVPVYSKDKDISLLAGVSVKDVCLKISDGKKVIAKNRGSILFTHKGLSGPCATAIGHEAYKLLKNKYKKELSGYENILFNEDNPNLYAASKSGAVMEYKFPGIDLNPGTNLEAHNDYIRYDNRDFFMASIDLAPDLSFEDFKKEIINFYKSYPKKEILTALKIILKNIPDRLLDLIFIKCKIRKNLKIGNLAKDELAGFYSIIKNLGFKIDSGLHFDEAIVTQGGIPVKEINYRDMQSTLITGLYFAGEIIELAGQEGGFNLQKAFSTGWLAGRSAAGALE